MKTSAIRPGLPTPGTPIGAASTPAMFWQGNHLTGCWARRPRFVLLDTRFGDGRTFLTTWAAWRQDPQRCERLVFIAIEEHPLCRSDLSRALRGSSEPDLARQLLSDWPPLTHNLHRLSFEQGRVQLLLAMGGVRQWLTELVASADAICLSAQETSFWDRYTLKSVGRLAAPGASLAMTGQDEGIAQDLRHVGFEVQHLDGATLARYAPRFPPHRPAGRRAVAPAAQHAIVIGAGLAGCAAAWALSEQGLDVTLMDQSSSIAQASSGNPLGLFHGTLNPGDGVHARFNRAAAIELQRLLQHLRLPGHLGGLLRTESTRSLEQMRSMLDALGLPPDYVQALDAVQASALSKIPSSGPAWFYPGGGALPPQELAQAFLSHAPRRVTLQTQAQIRRLLRAADGWQLLNRDGKVVAETPLVVVTAGAGSLDLLADRAWPMRLQRGQVTQLPGATKGLRVPAMPIAGAGYVVPDGSGGVWCGATAQDHDRGPELRESDHAHNIAQLMRLSGAELDTSHLNRLHGRVGWRVIAEDRLPLVGAVPVTDPGAGSRRDQARLIARQPGLLVCTAMASRGITWAALCAQVVAALATGAPCPVEASLLDAIDPARFDARRSRQPAP